MYTAPALTEIPAPISRKAESIRRTLKLSPKDCLYLAKPHQPRTRRFFYHRGLVEKWAGR